MTILLTANVEHYQLTIVQFNRSDENISNMFTRFCTFLLEILRYMM